MNAKFLTLFCLLCVTEVWSRPTRIGTNLSDSEVQRMDSTFTECFNEAVFEDVLNSSSVDFAKIFDNCLQKSGYSATLPSIYAGKAILSNESKCLNKMEVFSSQQESEHPMTFREWVGFEKFALSEVDLENVCERVMTGFVRLSCAMEKFCSDEESQLLLDARLVLEYYELTNLRGTNLDKMSSCPILDVEINPAAYHYGFQPTKNIPLFTKRLDCSKIKPLFKEKTDEKKEEKNNTTFFTISYESK